MFPFAMQAKLTEAWLDAAAASFAMAGSMGTAAARSLEPWMPASTRPSYAFSFWTPLAQPAPVWPWSWFAGFGAPAAASWWQPMSFYGDWMRAFTYAAPSNGWLMTPQAWTAAFPLARPYSAFLTPFASPLPQLFPSPAEAGVAMIAASYRTASGHATAAIFDALMPRQSNWTTAPWQLSPAWMFMR